MIAVVGSSSCFELFPPSECRGVLSNFEMIVVKCHIRPLRTFRIISDLSPEESFSDLISKKQLLIEEHNLHSFNFII